LEALSATGLRSIRYAKEVPGVREITANDISEKAASSIRENVAHNGVDHLVTTSHDDAV
jgi:tRNA (guanine26-N2/guanine27-N2)-dimethyltransferase